jgi:uncharacterized protein involved in response to NO
MSKPPGGIPRYRPFGGPALFRQGFRPFFLGAALWAAAGMAIWLPLFTGEIALPIGVEPVVWHAHEMLFGFAAAALGGFLLTAIPNWTGRLPLQGWPLAVLAASWLAGRVALLLGAAIGPLAAALIDLSYLVALAAVVLREIVAGRNWRNLPMPGALCVLIAANLLVHLGAAGHGDPMLGIRLAIGALLMLIGLVGGRIIPSFTRNWLAKQGAETLPAGFGALDQAALAVSAAALSAWIAAWPVAAGPLLIAAGVLAAIRLARWRGHVTGREPLVLVLHLGHLWLAAGLALLGVSQLWAGVPAGAAVHALTVGAIGTMIPAVMTRATLGHTGRGLTAGAGTTVIYGLVAAAALLRMAAALASAAYVPLLHAAAGCWIGAFLLFAALYGRALLTPRPE